MAKPRRGFLFELDARVLSAGAERHRIGEASFYGLQLSEILHLEKRSVYKSLARLTELGLVDRWWEDQEIATAAGRPRRRLYALNVHGCDALPDARLGRRALGRQWPKDSNSRTPVVRKRASRRSSPFGSRP